MRLLKEWESVEPFQHSWQRLHSDCTHWGFQLLQEARRLSMDYLRESQLVPSVQETQGMVAEIKEIGDPYAGWAQDHFNDELPVVSISKREVEYSLRTIRDSCKAVTEGWIEDFRDWARFCQRTTQTNPTNAPLTDGQQDVWDALKGRALSGKELAKKLDTSDETIRQHVIELRKAGFQVPNLRGRGYYRPDAPPDDSR